MENSIINQEAGQLKEANLTRKLVYVGYSFFYFKLDGITDYDNFE